MINIGKKVPDFTLKDKDGIKYTLSKMKSKYFVVYFYPKDNTPGCAIEANKFNDALSEFEKLNVQIIGISGGDEKTKTKFCEKYDLSLLLLSDPDFAVCKKYEAYGPKSFMGKKFDGIFRITYLLDSNMKVLKTYENVKVKEHADQILRDIKELGV